MKQTTIRKGDIFWIDFDPAKASEIQKTRPALVCSHDLLNMHTNRIIVAPITSNITKIYPFDFAIIKPDVKGKVMIDQIRSLDKIRLGKKIDSLTFKEMNEVDNIIKFIFAME